jgi:hypothetical protein
VSFFAADAAHLRVLVAEQSALPGVASLDEISE